MDKKYGGPLPPPYDKFTGEDLFLLREYMDRDVWMYNDQERKRERGEEVKTNYGPPDPTQYSYHPLYIHLFRSKYNPETTVELIWYYYEYVNREALMNPLTSLWYQVSRYFLGHTPLLSTIGKPNNVGVVCGLWQSYRAGRTGVYMWHDDR